MSMGNFRSNYRFTGNTEDNITGMQSKTPSLWNKLVPFQKSEKLKIHIDPQILFQINC